MPTPSSEAILYPSPIPMGDPVELRILNPLEYPGWDDLLLTHENYSFFHSSAWARVLSESYNYKPLYFTAIENGTLSALIPVMEIRSLLTGRRGVSLPFSDYCEPIAPDKSHFLQIIDDVIKYGKKAGWKFIELRGATNLYPDIIPSSSFYLHTLGLSQDEEKVFSEFRKGTKSSIKKAIRDGVIVQKFTSLDSVKQFYRLQCMTRRKHSLPPQPLYFFNRIHHHIISKNLGFVVLASYEGKYIAAAIFFHMGKRAIYKYGASDVAYLHVSPNNLILWEAIKYYSQEKYENLSFGRTDLKNSGLRRFKVGWGTEEEELKYYKYDLKKRSFVISKQRETEWYNKLFSRMPLSLLRISGSLLYKHMG